MTSLSCFPTELRLTAYDAALLEEVTLRIAEMKVDNKKVAVTAVNVFGGGDPSTAEWTRADD